MARTEVSASTVRAWGRENVEQVPEGARAGLSETARGRIHPDLKAAYEKANKRFTYVTGSEAEKPTITVPVVMLDKAGRKTTRPVTVTTEYARTLLGHAPKTRGRFNKGDLALALEAERLAD